MAGHQQQLLRGREGPFSPEAIRGSPYNAFIAENRFMLLKKLTVLQSISEVTICPSLVGPLPSPPTNVVICGELKLSLLPSGHR